MVVVNPGFVVGPLLQPTLNATSAIVLNLINGMYRESRYNPLKGNSHILE